MDIETGLFWDRDPDTISRSWRFAIADCNAREIGGRLGWHLPMLNQLTSLVDINSNLCIGGGPCLPDGHPFLNVQSTNYWSATTSTVSSNFAGSVGFDIADVGGIRKDADRFRWCARAGQAYDGQDMIGALP